MTQILTIPKDHEFKGNFFRVSTYDYYLNLCIFDRCQRAQGALKVWITVDGRQLKLAFSSNENCHL